MLERIAIVRIMDVLACVRKHLVAAPVAQWLMFFIRIGMMANKFISKPAQMRNQCQHNIVMKVPVKIVREMVSWASGLISTGRIKPTFLGYGPNSLFSCPYFGAWCNT